MTARLSTLQAAFVVARRDFTAILFSRSFLFFLLGPLFPVIVGIMAGGVGKSVQESAERPQLGVAMAEADIDRLIAARKSLAPEMGGALPDLLIVERLTPGATYNPAGALEGQDANIAAMLTGTLARPELTGAPGRIEQWRGPVALMTGRALDAEPTGFPEVRMTSTARTSNGERHGRLLTAQGAQTLLFLLTMLLAGMVLSNLVEEKGNKIIEVLAAAIPMDAVFLGKLFAMLAISLVGIALWGGVAGSVFLAAREALPDLAAPAVGWPLFMALFILYFAMAYLLLGSVFLSVGSLAATVREVQTISMPVTMVQLLVFFLASFAMTQPGSAIETFAIVFPFSSPFAMLARAAGEPVLWPHVAALAWQALCVLLFVRIGARLFRSRVMKSGQGPRAKRKGLLARLKPGSPATS